MKNVALLALLSAPAALAFTPTDIEGVWHCIPEDGQFYVAKQTETVDVQWKDAVNEKSERIITFDAPTSKSTRLFNGRTYYTVGTKTEEHKITGTFTNALQADFYLDPNNMNTECCCTPNGTSACSANSALSDFTTKAIGAGKYNKVCNPTGTGPVQTTSTADAWNGSCRDHPMGPFKLVLDDIDHFTLTVHHKDEQVHHSTHDTTKGIATTPTFEHVFVIEKCMRGLPEDNEMCDDLEHSNIVTTSEKDAACQGALACRDKDSNDSKKGQACKLPTQQVLYQPQPYYQPQYYQPQYYQPQYQQQTYYQPQQFGQYTPQWSTNWFG